MGRTTRKKPYKKQRGGSVASKTLVLYCYYETDETKKNLEFFVKNGVFQSDKYTYVFIINNNVCTVTIPDYSNIQKKVRAENESDLQSYSWCISDLKKTDANYFSSYTNIYFINSSCIGPFMPTICDKNWIDHLNTVSTGYDLVGPIIEFPNDTKGYTAIGIEDTHNIPFIHTYMFGTSSKGFENVSKTLADIAGKSKDEIVNNTERKITSSILMSKLKIKTLLLRFKNVDVNDPVNWYATKWNTDVNLSCYEKPENYFGIDVNPLEVIFVKNIRNTNETRNKNDSGISEWLKKTLHKYVEWLPASAEVNSFY